MSSLTSLARRLYPDSRRLAAKWVIAKRYVRHHHHMRGDPKWRPLRDVVCDLRELHNPVANEAADLLLDMNEQIRRQRAHINLLKMVEEERKDERYGNKSPTG